MRQARREDIAAMHRVRMSVTENRLVSVSLTEAAYLAASEEPGRAWVVESGGEIVGFAVGNGATGNVWALFVHPEHEGRGHGRRLHDAMIGWMLQRGGPTPWLTTEPGTRAEQFYKAAGWTPTGTTDSGEVRFELLSRIP